MRTTASKREPGSWVYSMQGLPVLELTMEFRDKITIVSVIVAALSLLLTAYGQLWGPRGDLRYETSGLDCTKNECRLAIFVRNAGSLAEEGVEFELPPLVKHTTIYVSSAYNLVMRGDRSLIELGTVHPGTSKYVTVTYPAGSKLESNEWQSLSIYSKARMAVFSGSGQFDEPWWVPVVEWVIAGYLTMMFVVAPLYFLFETKAAKRKRWAEERARYVKLVAGLDAKLARIPIGEAEGSSSQKDVAAVTGASKKL
jgi:hypothetical protein